MQSRERRQDVKIGSPNSSLEAKRYQSSRIASDAVSGRSKHDFLESIRSKLVLKYGSDSISKQAID